MTVSQPVSERNRSLRKTRRCVRKAPSTAASVNLRTGAMPGDNQCAGEGSHDPVDDRQIDPEHKLDDESHGAADGRDLKRAKSRQPAQGKSNTNRFRRSMPPASALKWSRRAREYYVATPPQA
jgi:hypothetical protein